MVIIVRVFMLTLVGAPDWRDQVWPWVWPGCEL